MHTFMAINHDAFATGFEEHMSTFSQEKRALNPVRIVVMEVLVYDVWLGVDIPELSETLAV